MLAAGLADASRAWETKRKTGIRPYGTDERLDPRQAQELGGAAVAEGRYSSTSDYIRDLVRRDQEQEEKVRRLQAAIDEGRA